MNRDAKIYLSCMLCVVLAALPFLHLEAAQETINATDNLPTSRPKINNNFTELYNGMNGVRSVATGGTGQSTYTNGQILIGNTTGGTLGKNTLTEGNGITITNGASSITIGLAVELDFDGKTVNSGVFTGGAFEGISITSSSFGNAVTLSSAAAPTTTAAQIAFDNNAWAASRGAVQVHDGTANTYLVGALASDTPTNGQVPTWNTNGTTTWETPSGSVSITDTHVPYGTGSGLSSEAAFTYTAASNTLGVDVITLGGTGTINGLDAIDATTEATIEAAMDTLANVTSIQGQTVTLTGAFIRSGAHSLTLTTTGTTTLTLPTSGTVAVIGGNTYTGTHTFDAATVTFGTITVTTLNTTNLSATSFALPTVAGTSALTSGQIALNTTDKQIGVHNGTKEVAIPLTRRFPFTFDPKAVCDGAVDRLFLFTVTEPKGITITSWRLSFEADPTTEVDLDLKRADAFIGVANSAVMDVLDTTAGASSESTAANINSGAVVANGKVVYLEFGTAYTETTHQCIFEITYEIEED